MVDAIPDDAEVEAAAEVVARRVDAEVEVGVELTVLD